MRTYASETTRQDQQPVRNRYSRPTCECFHRFQHSLSSWQPRTICDKSERLQHEPRIAAIHQGDNLPNQSSHDQNKQREPVEPVYYVRRSQPISPTPESKHVPTINSIDSVTISSPTETTESGTPKIKVKTHLDSFTKPDSEDTSARPPRTTDKQEIVVRIEICPENRPNETTNATVMSSVTEGTLANETSTSLESNNLQLETNPAAKEKKGCKTSQVKCSLNSAPTLHPLQKLAYTDKNISSARNTSLPPKQGQRNALVTTEILGHPLDLLVYSGASISIIDVEFVQEVFSGDHTHYGSKHLSQSGHSQWRETANNWTDRSHLIIQWKEISLSIPCCRKHGY